MFTCKCGKTFQMSDDAACANVDACPECSPQAQYLTELIGVPMFLSFGSNAACITGGSNAGEIAANPAPHEDGVHTESQGKSAKPTE